MLRTAEQGASRSLLLSFSVYTNPSSIFSSAVTVEYLLDAANTILLIPMFWEALGLTHRVRFGRAGDDASKAGKDHCPKGLQGRQAGAGFIL